MTKQDPQTMAAIEQAFERWSQKRSPESIARQDMMQFFPQRIRQAGCSEQTIQDVDQALETVWQEDFDV